MMSCSSIKHCISRFFIYILILVCSWSLYDKYNTCNKSNFVQIIKEAKFSTLGPYDNVELPVEDIYDKLINIRNFSFIKNPQPCKSYNAGILLLIIVSSNPNNFDNREVIRNTWGKNMESTKIIFLFGETKNNNVRKRIQNESSKYGDIVQGNFVDAYRNMTYKHVMGLKWIAHHCPTAKYILKVDDDVVINISELRHFLAKELSPWGAKDLIMCQLIKNSKAQRSKKLKWNVSKKEYALEYYPTYCAGWAILYSQDVIRRLLKTVQELPYFWIDDVQITGICAQKIGIPRTSFSYLMLPNGKIQTLKDLGYIYVGPFVFGPNEQKAPKIKEIWKEILESYS